MSLSATGHYSYLIVLAEVTYTGSFYVFNVKLTSVFVTCSKLMTEQCRYIYTDTHTHTHTHAQIYIHIHIKRQTGRQIDNR